MLNLNQKRSLGITLGIVEEELKRLRQLLHDGKEEGLFSRIADDLTAEEKRLLNERIERLMEYLIFLKNFFDLRYSQKEMTLRGIVKAIALYLSVLLEERMSKRLTGYGEIAPGLKESLDPQLNEMIAILQQMESIK